MSIVVALGSTLGVAIFNLSAREAKDPSLPRLTQFDWLAARHIGSDPRVQSSALPNAQLTHHHLHLDFLQHSTSNVLCSSSYPLLIGPPILSHLNLCTFCSSLFFPSSIVIACTCSFLRPRGTARSSISRSASDRLHHPFWLHSSGEI